MTKIQTISAHRKAAALTQEELAGLLDVSQTVVSRLEREAPSMLVTALGLQVIFGVQPRVLFAALYAEVEEAVMARAAGLDRSLPARTDAVLEKKRSFLSSMAKRATSRVGV